MRLFIGVGVNSLINHLNKLQDSFNEVIDAKYVEKNNLHITINYLGNYNPYRAVKKLEKINFNKFISHTDSLGVFPNLVSPKVLYLSLEPKKEFIKLNELTTKITRHKTRNTYHPHITLARIKQINDNDKFVNLLNKNYEKKNIKINSFNLYSSQLTNNGPVYTIIKEFDLKA